MTRKSNDASFMRLPIEVAKQPTESFAANHFAIVWETVIPDIKRNAPEIPTDLAPP